MRYDSLQCNGGKIARTPVADKLSEEGINYRRANNQNVVCMPARSSMITGQYVRTHGVFANGRPLPEHAPRTMWHYGKWLAENHPAYVSGFYQLFTSKGLNDEPGGDTGAPEVKFNPLPRECYHTDWVGERTSRWLDT